MTRPRRERRGWHPLRWVAAVLAVVLVGTFGFGWIAAHGVLRPMTVAWVAVIVTILAVLFGRRPTYRTRRDVTCRWCTWKSGCICPDAQEDM